MHPRACADAACLPSPPARRAPRRGAAAAETLALYARLRGVPEPAVAAAVRPLLFRLGLEALAARPAGAYSGGNRRRLSVGVALVGAPQVVLLDEPSTGMVRRARPEDPAKQTVAAQCLLHADLAAPRRVSCSH
jgi:ABC-type Na+ transport system ATPase subunit NatA